MILSDNTNKGTNNPENMDEFFAKFDEEPQTPQAPEKPASASEAYNVAGQRVSPSAKGLIIQNGHKIMK